MRRSLAAMIRAVSLRAVRHDLAAGLNLVAPAALLAAAVLVMAWAPRQAAHAETRPEIPVAAPVKAVAEPAGPVMRRIVFSEPVPGFAVNSRYGQRRLGGGPGRLHKGVDIAAPQGTGVFAAAEGRVLRTGHDADGYGLFVEVSHPNGMTSLYAHLSRIDVARGDAVPAGRRLGLVGSTGRSTGPHLHFEVRRNERALNPQNILGQAFAVAAKPPF